MSFYDAIRVGASGADDFEIERSIRNDLGTADVNSGSSFEKTYSSAGNRKTFTISVWVKKCDTPGTVGDDGYSIFTTGGGGSGAQNGNLHFQNNDSLYFTSQPQPSANAQFITTRKFRDPSAWYHIVVAVDTTQATQSNRVKIYINGVQETSFSTETYPSQNADLQFNQAERHRLGSNSLGSNLNSTYANFNGYLADFNFIDGLALAPSSFAETNATTGQWNPIDTSGLTFGSNGFRLEFKDNSGTTATTLGKDTSGNSNNFTPNNFGTGDSVKDSPTNNFCTQSYINSTQTTLNEGALKIELSNSNARTSMGTIGVKSGKWYYEVYYNSSTNNALCVGFANAEYTPTNRSGNVTDAQAQTDNIGYYAAADGFIYYAAGTRATLSGGQGYAAGDIVGVAADFDNNQVYFYKNGSAISSANPYSYTFVDKVYLPTISNLTSGGNQTGTVNYGQDSTFAGATSSGGNTDGSGIGDFKYAVPSGFKAICSKNMPNPSILLPNKHFDSLPYSGAGGTQSVTGLEFQPDWVWLKRRSSGSSSHVLSDSVRGVNLKLASDKQDAEAGTANGTISSFNSNGFTLAEGGGTYPAHETNKSGETYVGWNWNAGDTDSKTYTVKVVSDSGNKYRFNNFGTSAVTLDLAEGGTYTFDGSDSSMSGHPFVIGTAANGSVYSTGVTYQLDGASVSYSAYTSGYSSASSRKLIITVPASAPVLYYWCSIHSGMGGQINTNSTLGSSNFDGSIQSTAKANTSAGFSIVGYTGTNGTGTIGHGLGVAPRAYIVKRRDNASDWRVYHQSLGNTNALKLNTSDQAYANSSYWNDTSPTSTTVSLGNDSDMNGSTDKYIAYCFSEVAGYSKFGSYIGNGNADGTFVFTGFRPAWVLTKGIWGSNWNLFDNKRPGLNVTNDRLFPNLSDAETDGSPSNNQMDLLSNGFKLRGNNADTNMNGETFIYLAFAESPFKNSRAR